MKKEPCFAHVMQNDFASMEHQAQNPVAAPSGIYHLIHTDGWHCAYISENCLSMLGCTPETFLDALSSCIVCNGKEEEMDVAHILRELAEEAGQQVYSTISRHGKHSDRRIKNALTSLRGADGVMQLYGQLTDITQTHNQIAPLETIEKYLERTGLLQVIQMSFHEILSINLTKGTYHIIQYHGSAVPGTPTEGVLLELLNLRLLNVAAEDQQAFHGTFYPEGLSRAAAEGSVPIQLTYRQTDQNGVLHWTETTVVHQENPCTDDILFLAVSRSIDAEKEQELRLREQVRLQDEALQITMSQIGNHISYYDIATGTLTTLPATAKLFGVSVVMENYPESFISNAPIGYPPETAEILRSFVGAIQRGEPTGHCDYPTVTANGAQIYLRRTFVNIYNDKGEAIRAVISSEDITQQKQQLLAQAADISGLLKVTQLIFPEILSCNLTQGTCKVLQSVLDTPRELPLDDFLASRLNDIAPEDRGAFRLQFFRPNQLEAIRNGRERFQLIYRRRRPEDGTWHWIETTALVHKAPHHSDILTFVVSHNIDRQKAQEELLQQALSDSADKLEGWLHYNNLSNTNFPGLVYISYDDDRPSPYIVGTLAKRLDCPAKELALSTCFRIPRADRDSLRRTCEEARLSDKHSYRTEYRVETGHGETVWINNQAVRFTDKDGSTGYIHFLTDVTHEHTLMEQLRLRMEAELQKEREVFQIVAQHSDRTLYAYDLATGITRPWDTANADKDILRHLYTGNYSDDALAKNSAVLPESRMDVQQFFSDIHSGVPSGTLNLHIRLADGTLRWYHFYYTSIFSNGSPVTALISVEDTTDRHEQEIIYQRHIQEVAKHREDSLIYLEVCLFSQRVEKASGSLINGQEADVMSVPYSEFGSHFLDPYFRFEAPEESSTYFSLEHLTDAYQRGERELHNTWKVCFNDDTTHWLDSEIIMLADPFNDHVKAFIRVSDITESHQAQLTILNHANNDSMTGLLRRGAGELRIREHLSAHQKPGGILLALDLDDLKGLNDTLGHTSGDEAIIGIATTLKEHFRTNDILIRAGGDEFLVFLPGAAKAIHSIELSVASLLRKLSAVAVGENGERTIHCSIGCAVELPDTDTFESLYQRADIALYHVKRNGKNNYAFFEPEMLEDNYRFRVRQAIPIMEEVLEMDNLRDLLSIVCSHYPGVVHFNLSRNHFRIFCVGANADLPAHTGRVDDFWANWRDNIHPDDWENVVFSLSRTSLTSLYTRGKRSFRHYYRNLESVGYVRTEIRIQLYPATSGDLCAFLFFRWKTDPKKEVESRRLHKLLSLYEDGAYEYVCLINVQDGSCSMFNMDRDNSYEIPETADFNTITMHIRDTGIPPERHEEYCQKAALEAVLTHMQADSSHYSYQYTMLDGIARQAEFSWFEDNHNELLMTVRKLP